MRSPVYSLTKAFAIILVAVAHSGAPAPLARFAYLLCVPVFFVLSGYLLKTTQMTDGVSYVQRRFQRLYLPFLKWSLFYLLLHNAFFALGLLSEHYGNAAGGVTHPYHWQQFSQALWSIVFNMSGYDAFLAGGFWFFRCLLLANLGFFIAWRGLSRWKFFAQSPIRIVSTIGLTALLLALWMTLDGLKVTGVAQGGYREWMGITLMAGGFLLHQLMERWTLLRNRWLTLCVGGSISVLLPYFTYVSMSHRAESWLSPLLLLVGGLGGFWFLRSLSLILVESPRLATSCGKLIQILQFVGDHSIYVLGFHLLAFKLVSALKVAIYGLPWEAVGSHPVVHQPQESFSWLLYVLVGVSLPLLILWKWQQLSEQHQVELNNPRHWPRILLLLLFALGKGLLQLGVGFLLLLRWGLLSIIRTIRYTLYHKRYIWRRLKSSLQSNEEYEDDGTITAGHTIDEIANSAGYPAQDPSTQLNEDDMPSKEAHTPSNENDTPSGNDNHPDIDFQIHPSSQP